MSNTILKDFALTDVAVSGSWSYHRAARAMEGLPPEYVASLKVRLAPQIQELDSSTAARLATAVASILVDPFSDASASGSWVSSRKATAGPLACQVSLKVRLAPQTPEPGEGTVAEAAMLVTRALMDSSSDAVIGAADSSGIWTHHQEVIRTGGQSVVYRISTDITLCPIGPSEAEGRIRDVAA
jgi:hypothetical protein